MITTIAASFIKNYKLLKNSVTHSGVLITNIHASVIERGHIEAKSRKLMPTSIVFNKKYVYMKKILFTALFFLSALIMFGQNRTVTGKVTNSEGKPVPFATVTVKGTSTAVSADENGNFSIQAPANAVLVFSSSGYQASEVNIGNETTVNSTLSGQGVLAEVVVTALGIKRSDRGLGYSVSKVNPDNLLQKSEPDILKGLEGKVAGVDIRSSQGTPGAATRIQIRGNNSFFGNSEPLIVVDGIPYSNDQLTTTSQVSNGGAYSNGISNLDPNDIATMNVLKGSSAAALYGSRASNGVIVITTKSGSARRAKGTEINLKSSFSNETIANLPEYQNEYGAGSQLGYSNANGSWGPAFGTLDSIPAWPSTKLHILKCSHQLISHTALIQTM